MEFRPHKYQDYAREFIIGHPVCALILDMGLGKTVITLTALWELALDYFEVGKVLVIAPFRVARDTWKEELEKWDHLKGLSVSVVVGSEKVILSRLVDTFISRISLTMLPVPNPHNTVCVLSWEEARHWQSRSSGYSSS